MLLVKDEGTFSAPEVPHTHEHDGFDIVLPDFKALRSDYVLWVALAISGGYLAYLVYHLIRDRKPVILRVVEPCPFEHVDTLAKQPTDESKGL